MKPAFPVESSWFEGNYPFRNGSLTISSSMLLVDPSSHDRCRCNQACGGGGILDTEPSGGQSRCITFAG